MVKGRQSDHPYFDINYYLVAEIDVISFVMRDHSARQWRDKLGKVRKCHYSANGFFNPPAPHSLGGDCGEFGGHPQTPVKRYPAPF